MAHHDGTLLRVPSVLNVEFAVDCGIDDRLCALHLFI